MGRVEVDGKTNELSAFRPLFEPLDLTDRVVTADALHTQRDHAAFLVTEKRAHFILIVKKNQRSLYHQLKACPGGRSRSGTPRTTKGTAGPNTAASRSARWPKG